GVHARQAEVPAAAPPAPLGKSAKAPSKAKASKKEAPPQKAKAPKISTAGMTAGGGRKSTRLRLYYELHWRGMRHGSVSFGAESARKGKPILASTAMGPEFP